MTKRMTFAGVAVLLWLCAVGSANGQPAGDAQRCRGLRSVDFSNVEDATTAIMSSSFVEAAEGLPAYCQVVGYVSPSVGFELRLPVAGWNGKFFEIGCGGMCGAPPIRSCNGALRRGYACIASDRGHRSVGLDGKWAYNNLQAKLDFAYRAQHVTLLSGRAITQHFYGAAPRKSYFYGCSAGGRSGFIEAQRWPFDFDGIIVVSPGSEPLAYNQIWTGQLLNLKGEAGLTDGDIATLHKAVLDACDRNDGLVDGIVGDPIACKVDWEKVPLSRPKIDTARKLYSGPVRDDGLRLTVGGQSLGSELSWKDVRALNQDDYLRYLAYWPDAGPSWSSENLDFAKELKRVSGHLYLQAGKNPDIRQFKEAGGKLLVLHGWTDPSTPPSHTVDYYTAVERLMGGRDQTQDFFRLFLAPGMDHCGGGAGADTFDLITALENWVEKGIAPDRLVGAKLKTRDSDPVFPLDPMSVAFTRPAFPFPTTTKYKGKGDPSSADNFVAYRAR